jgi:hypothetical protein
LFVPSVHTEGSEEDDDEVDAFVWASLAITLASGVDYVFRLAKIVNQ